jgi:hypothetical protein
MKEEKTDYEPPKIIHFIWAGGEKLMPEQCRKTVADWSAQYNSKNGCKVCIWVDKKTTSSEKLEEFRNCKELKGTEVEFVDINTLENACSKDKILQKSYDLIRYELDKITTNYGISSDLLRYLILYVVGGVYFDSDINPNNKNMLIDSKYFKENKKRYYRDERTSLFKVFTQKLCR